MSMVIATPASALSSEEWVMAFVRFVEWPAAATAGGDGAVVICQPTETPELDLAGKQVRGQVLLVMRIARPRDIERCHLFAALPKREFDWQPWLAAIKGRPVLTVGLGGNFCELGGSICLVADEATGGERYRLNLDTLSRAGFKVNSQLLRLQPQRAKVE